MGRVHMLTLIWICTMRVKLRSIEYILPYELLATQCKCDLYWTFASSNQTLCAGTNRFGFSSGVLKNVVAAINFFITWWRGINNLLVFVAKLYVWLFHQTRCCNAWGMIHRWVIVLHSYGYNSLSLHKPSELTLT